MEDDEIRHSKKWHKKENKKYPYKKGREYMKTRKDKQSQSSSPSCSE